MDKEQLLNDISKVYKEGLYLDVTLVLADNISVSTNRFMLACRIPYFATLLFSEFEEKSSDILSLQFCSSDIFHKILAYVWEGEINMSDMPINDVLILLETSRFLCLDILAEGIVEYLKLEFEAKRISFESSLTVLEFSIRHKFSLLSSIVLRYVDQNLREISSLPDFEHLSSSSIMAALHSMREGTGRVSSEITVFQAFLVWLGSNSNVSENVKKEMIGSFDLERFSNSDLETVKHSGIFDDRIMCDHIHSRLSRLEENIESKERLLESQGPARINLTQDDVESRVEGDAYKSVFNMSSCRFINCLEFTLGGGARDYHYSYTLQSSSDGVSWDIIEDRSREHQHQGKQVVLFPRRKVKYLSLKFLCARPPTFRSELTNVYAVML